MRTNRRGFLGLLGAGATALSVPVVAKETTKGLTKEVDPPPKNINQHNAPFSQVSTQYWSVMKTPTRIGVSVVPGYFGRLYAYSQGRWGVIYNIGMAGANVWLVCQYDALRLHIFDATVNPFAGEEIAVEVLHLK